MDNFPLALIYFPLLFNPQGHQHDYERYRPLYANITHSQATDPFVDFDSCEDDSHTYRNPRATVSIVTGAAGNREMPYVNTDVDDDGSSAHGHEAPAAEPGAGLGGGWPKPTNCTAEYLCCDYFGYGKVVVHNATHLEWTWLRVDPLTTSTNPYDHLWLIQENHGPFAA